MLPISRLVAQVALALVAGELAQPSAAWWLFSSEPHANATAAGKLAAVANFDMDGAKGWFRFSRASATAPTLVEYDLHGLQGNNQLYHVHERPVPAFDADQVRRNASAIARLCAEPATGGHLNPYHVSAKLAAKSAPLDRYETGDLSGKHGPLARAPGEPDRYVGSFVDERLPLAGAHAIVGRSLVIHRNDGRRWICASIVAAS